MVLLRSLWSLFVTAVILVGVIVGNLIAKAVEYRLFAGTGQPDLNLYFFNAGMAVAGGLIGFLFALVFFRKIVTWISYFENVPLLDKIAALIGTVLGLVVAILVTFPLTAIPGYGLPIAIFASVAGVVVGIGFAMSAKEQLAYVFPALSKVPTSGVSTSAMRGATPKMVDTNIIIDGRICSIVASGFIEGTICVPDFVLGELHHIADSEDNLKRARGRRGLDMLNRLKTMDDVDVIIVDDYTEEEAPYDEVDTRLVRLAKARGARVLTNDFGVAEIAKLHGVPVLNVNELATTLKPVYLPGEAFAVALIKEGKEQDQAVGYLEDGTMVVVKRAANLVGKTVLAEVETVLQTSAGKMIFAVMDGCADDSE
ncbi:MAG TPA: PIN domain-containing protein [Armatimonadota bacterium]|jgi:uncharacterized protein YacL